MVKKKVGSFRIIVGQTHPCSNHVVLVQQILLRLIATERRPGESFSLHCLSTTSQDPADPWVALLSGEWPERKSGDGPNAGQCIDDGFVRALT